MKKLILIFLLFPLFSFAANPTMNIWYVSHDTITQLSEMSISVKGYYNTSTDTGRVYMKNQLTSKMIEVYKVNLYDLFSAQPTGYNSTHVLTFIVPTSCKGNTPVSVTYNSDPRVWNIFVRSYTPDLAIKGLGVFSGDSAFSTFIKVGFTYEPKTTDSLELFFDNELYKKIALTDLLSDSIVDFTVDKSPGQHRLTTNYILNTPTSYLDYTIKDAVKTSIINPLSPPINLKITFFNIQGLEIEKPNEGIYLWKSENGESGKSFIY